MAALVFSSSSCVYSHVTGYIQNPLVWNQTAASSTSLFHHVGKKKKNPTGWWTCMILINDSCLPTFVFCSIWAALALLLSDKDINDGGQYKSHRKGSSSSSPSPSISQSFSHSLCQSSSGLMGVADRWQSHFHSGVVPCCLGAKPCNSYKCHIKSQPGRWEWQSDREAIHNRHYLCLCGWHPQIEMCSCSVPVWKQRHV